MTGLAQITLPAIDLAASKTFFAEGFALTHLFDAPNVAAFDAGGVRLLLVTGAPASPTGGATLFFSTRDIAQRHAELIRDGAPDRGAPHCVAVLDSSEVWIAFVADPAGNTIGLIEEGRASQSP